MKDKRVYKTRDFYLGVSLAAYGISLKSLECINNNIFYFVFDTSEENAEKIISSYWDRSLKLPARNFVEAINELKTRIHTGR